MIGAGKFGAMYIAQVPRTPGVHLVGIADLSPDSARKNLERVGWPKESYEASSLDAAIREKRTHLSEDWEALVAHPAIDIIIESTGNPPAAVEHALAAFRNGKHVVMVTVEADAFCGPLLARKAAEAGVVYSLAYGDQPALICDLVDWARTAGFPVVAAGRGHKWLPHYAQSTPDTVWGYYGLTPEQAKAGGPEPEDVQFLPRRLEAGDRDERGVQRHRTHACARRPAVPAGLGGRHSFPHAPEVRGRRAAPQGAGGGGLLAAKRTAQPIAYDIRFGVWVVFEGESEYIRRCFMEYGVKTDPSNRYACMYKRWHLIGLEVGISVASVGLRARADRLRHRMARRRRRGCQEELVDWGDPGRRGRLHGASAG